MLIKVERNKYINFLSKGENVRECRMKLEESVSEVNEKNKFLIFRIKIYQKLWNYIFAMESRKLKLLLNSR